jgi:hypothetical protein
MALTHTDHVWLQSSGLVFIVLASVLVLRHGEERRMGSDARFGEKYQPHWMWATCFIFVPFCLTALGFLGISRGSFVSLRVAALGPQLAVLVSLGGIVAASIHRRKLAVGIAALGLAISVGGFLLLLWVT